MSSNLPPGVSESTFGAPWNDQEYYCNFYFVIVPGYNDIELSSQELTVYFGLSGPMSYTESELQSCAEETIKDEYADFINDYSPEIIINGVYGD